MPNNNQTIAYAAGASLAAITLVYVFAPSYIFDGEDASSSRRRKGVVGLINPGNDCFVNSVLQALAGSPKIRKYLSARVNYAKTSGEIDELDRHDIPLLSLHLKNILDQLNEKPLQRKTISAGPFLEALERKYKQRISRNQQDAQEFLQAVCQKLEEEFDSGKKLFMSSQPSNLSPAGPESSESSALNPESSAVDQQLPFPPLPLAGQLQSTLTCKRCNFTPAKPHTTPFILLTLTVPQKSSTTLGYCLDSLLLTETIDDYLCSSCLLIHTLKSLPPNSPHVPALQNALHTNPEEHPEGIPLLRDSCPRVQISRITKIVSYPPILALHLSRSIFDGGFGGRKNSCKVTFQEYLELGGLLEKKKKYKLMGVVTHKGGHDSGHYECFRRHLTGEEPFSPTAGIDLNDGLPRASSDVQGPRGSSDSTVDTETQVTGSNSSSSVNVAGRPSISTTVGAVSVDSQESSPAGSVLMPIPSLSDSPELKAQAKSLKKKKKRKHKLENKWWRISDAEIREVNTKDVLAMEKEAYMLFYERVEE